MKNEIINELIDTPVMLNCWKHHKGFIQSQIFLLISEGEDILQVLPSKLLRIGDSQLDLYTGELSPQEIANLILQLLDQLDIKDINKFRSWLKHDHKDYKNIELNDTSRWTMRLGVNKEKYIHIHPARYSPYSLRFKALTLKSAIAAIVWSAIYSEHADSLKSINYVRQKFLNSPPVKSISSCGSLIKLIHLLQA